MKFLQNMPNPLKIGLLAGLLIVAVVLGVLLKDHLLVVIIILAIGAAISIGVLLLFNFLQRRKESRQGDAFGEGIKQGARNNPQSLAADKARKARLDDLAGVFEEGVQKYRGAGKNLYSLPWYLLVGPPGSGKTEAMRHSNIGFPPGLQDPLQGTGGTLSMHWWFTNTAVVLDTAGRLFMSESVNPAENSEWKEFLKLLKRVRGKCPINGMLLAVDIETLLKDNSEQIEKKAGLIARQLDVIQRVLDVRFPVFVLVTKCDRIVGFREFFETMNDPQAAHQMLGWSNPAELDEAFSPDAVDAHLQTVREALLKRRRLLMLDPAHTEDPAARRTDQVDSMYAFPDGIASIGPRLRRFLELIFVAGEWSPKPLFLRGIYFTSSLQEGRSLDEALAKALGCAIDELPGDAVPRKDKSYFLRDLFTQKVFREKGLVTSAVNVSKAQRTRRAALLGTGMAFAAVLIGLTFLGGMDLSKRVLEPAKAWGQAAKAYKEIKAVDDDNPLAIIRKNSKGGFEYAGGDVVSSESEVLRADLPVATEAQATTKISAGPIFTPLAFLIGDSDTLSEDRMKAHRAVLEASTLVPLVKNVRQRLTKPEAWGLTDDFKTLPGLNADQIKKRRDAATASLAQLIRLDTQASKEVPKSIATEVAAGNDDIRLLDIEPMILFLEGGEPAADAKVTPAARKAQIAALAETISHTYMPKGKLDTDAWPPAVLRCADASSKAELKLAAGLFSESAKLGSDDGFGPVVELFASLAAFGEADKSPIRWPSDSAIPAERTLTGFDAARTQWDTRSAAILGAIKRVDDARTRLAMGKRPIDKAFVSERETKEAKRIEDSYNKMLGELPENPAAGGKSGILNKAGEAMGKVIKSDAESAVGSAISGAGRVGAEGLNSVKRDVTTAGGEAAKDPKATFAMVLNEGKLIALKDIADQGVRFRDLLDKNAKETIALLDTAANIDCDYRLLCKQQALIAVTAELKGDADKNYDAAKGSSLSAVIKNIDVAREVILAKTTSRWDLDAAGSKEGITGLDSITRALNAARAARTARLIDAYTKMRRGNDWSDLAAKFPSSESDASQQPIPMTNLVKDWKPEDRYRWQAAKSLFDDYSKADEECSDKNTLTGRALDADRLRTVLTEIRPSLRDYAVKYFEYWTNTLGAFWQCREFNNWTEFRTALSNVSDANSASAVVQAFLDGQVVKALDAIPPSVAEGTSNPALTKDKLTGARAKAAAEAKALDDAGVRSKMFTVLSKWKDLPSTSGRSAMDAIKIGSPDPESIERTYFGYSRNPQASAPPTSEYWNSIWLQGLRLIAQERKSQAVGKSGLKEQLARFPLAIPGAGSPLSVDEVKSVSSDINYFVNKVLEKEILLPLPLGSPLAIVAEFINSEFSKPAASDLGSAAQLATQTSIAKALSADVGGLPVQFTIMGNTLNRDERDFIGASAIYARVLVNGKALKLQKDSASEWTNMVDIEKTFPCEAVIGRDEILIQFSKDDQNAVVMASVTLGKPWNLLEGLRNESRGPKSIDENGRRTWLLPFIAKSADNPPKDYTAWIKMQEKNASSPTPLPPVEKWPRVLP